MIVMKRFLILPLLLAALPIVASDVKVSTAEEQAVRKLVADYAEAVNSRDSARIAELFAEDGDYQTPQGAVSNGRTAIQQDQAKAYSTVMGSASATFEIKRIRFLSRDIALVDTVFERFGVLDPDGRPVPGRRRALATFILKKEKQWRIASYRNVVPVAFVPGGPTIFSERE
jgi:uncharacterized protein (TIGR02246 family)